MALIGRKAGDTPLCVALHFRVGRNRALVERTEAGADGLNDLLAEKRKLYEQYWSRGDDYWKPCSFGWPSNHERAAKAVSFTAPHLFGGVLDVAIAGALGHTTYRLERIDGDMKITDQLIGWGKGFIWPSVP